MQYEIRGFTSVQMTITVNYTYSVEHNTGLFKIELSLDMLDTCFDVFMTVHHNIDLFHLPTLMHNYFIH